LRIVPSFCKYLFVLILLIAASGCSGGGGGGGTSSQPARKSIFTTSPTALIAVANSNSITLAWSAVPGATSYKIYRLQSSPVTAATGSNVASVESPGTSYIDTIVLAGTRYYYVITWVIGGVESTASAEVSAVPGPAGGTRTLTGSVFYEDKEYGLSGFTGSTFTKAVRYATVDIIDSASSSILQSGATDSTGVFSITYGAGTSTVYVRVNSEATPPGSAVVDVNTLAASLYGVRSVNFAGVGAADLTIFVPVTSPAGGAFNILDVLTTGYEFVNYLNGSYPSVPLTSYWATENFNGTYFCTGIPYVDCPVGEGIYVYNNSSNLSFSLDTDGYDDDVLWHEFGHFVAYSYSMDDSPGGPHALGQNDQDLRLSWSEGWGDFFPGAIKNWISTSGQNGLLSSAVGVPLTMYIDTDLSGDGIYLKENFGNPSVNSSYSSNEVAVAKLLHDLNAAFTMQFTWNVVKDFRSNPPLATVPVNLELFWDRWLSNNGLLAGFLAKFTDRSIYYDLDSFEGDSQITTAKTYTAGSPQSHTLYATGDEDFIKFTATSKTHTITTDNLSNGADTYLSLFGPTQLFITDNDNAVPRAQYPPNDATSLSSRISYISFVVGNTYYVSVKSSPSRPVSAGKYGSYTLTISP